MGVISIVLSFISPYLMLSGGFVTSTFWLIPHSHLKKAYSNHDNRKETKA
jgi:hypothetical protein